MAFVLRLIVCWLSLAFISLGVWGILHMFALLPSVFQNILDVLGFDEDEVPADHQRQKVSDDTSPMMRYFNIFE